MWLLIPRQSEPEPNVAMATQNAARRRIGSTCGDGCERGIDWSGKPAHAQRDLPTRPQTRTERVAERKPFGTTSWR